MAEIKTPIELVIDNIKNDHRHDWYDRTVKKSELYTILSTGENSEKLLRKFAMRENDTMFEQRKLLTQEITSSVVKTLSDVNYKVPRSPGITKIYEYPQDSDKNKDLQNVLDVFNGYKSFDDYLETRVVELNDTDPNAWIVIESDSTDGTTRLRPYPFEVSSAEAINFEIVNNILQWLLVRNDIKYKDKEGKEHKGYKFTLYGTDGWVKFEQIAQDMAPGMLEEDTVTESDGERFTKIGNDVYVITSGTYNTGGVVPAFRVGYNPDKYTKAMTMVPSWNAAISYLKKTVKAVSELDLATALHIFHQKISYAPECNVCKGQGRVECRDCDSGYATCDSCDGKGREIATSTQDAITFTLPKTANPDELINLENLVHYVDFSTDIPRWQNEYIDSLIIKCKEVVFNAGVFNKEDINKTATGVGENRENIYDSLYSYAVYHSVTWKFGVSVIANLTSLQEGLDITTNVSRDLKLKTKNDYLNDLKLAKDAGASQSVMNNIEQQIVRVDFEDNPTMFNKHLTQQYFFPFSGKDETEVAGIIAMLPPTDYYKVLWVYYGIIYQEIELDHDPNIFYNELDKKEQKKIIDKYVAQKQEALKNSEPNLDIPD